MSVSIFGLKALIDLVERTRALMRNPQGPLFQAMEAVREDARSRFQGSAGWRSLSLATVDLRRRRKFRYAEPGIGGASGPIMVWKGDLMRAAVGEGPGGFEVARPRSMRFGIHGAHARLEKRAPFLDEGGTTSRRSAFPGRFVPARPIYALGSELEEIAVAGFESGLDFALDGLGW